jgi:tetratricopeptide (TPR) repeat protein
LLSTPGGAGGETRTRAPATILPAHLEPEPNMLRISTVVAALSAVLVAAAPARAQHEDHPAARQAEKLGTVSFANSCSAELRADFDRAVALLHSFEFSAAIEGFDAVLARDARCAIAHWGIALSYWGNPFAGARSVGALQQGLAAVGKARTTGAPTARERAYIDAVATLFERYETVSQRDRILAYESALAGVARQYPEDVEAAIFHALALAQTAVPNDKTYAAQLRAAAILEPLYTRYPDHPGLAHYIIHAYDHPPLAARALAAARSYAGIAPSAPHALHMPSHTFTRVGSWQESIDTNRLSEQSAVRNGVATEALHAMDYQTYAHLQMAQDAAARDVLGRLPAVAARFDAAATAGGAAPPMAGFYALAAIPARYALERGAWQEAAELPVPASGTPFTIAIAHFARALGAARSGRADAASGDVARLAALRDQLAGQDAYWAEQVDIQWRTATAWVAFADERGAGGRARAVEAMRAAADIEDASDKAAVTPGPLAPARELLGEMLLEAGNPAGALEAFEASIAKEPGRFRGAFGAARAAEAAGDTTAAQRHYRRALEIAQRADSPRPEIQRARSFLGAQ